MKICIIANFTSRKGGLLVATEALMVRLEKKGHNFIKLVEEEKPYLKYPKTIWKLLRLSGAYDVIIVSIGANYSFIRAIIAVIAGKLWKKKVIVWCHSGDIDRTLSLWGFLLKPIFHNSRIVVPSPWSANVFLRHGIKAQIVPNMLDESLWRYRCRKVYIPKILFAKHLEKCCGPDLAIKAFSLIQEKVPSASLTMTGDGPMREELMAMVEKYQLKNVSLPGRIPFDNMAEVYDEHDILLLPSRAESFGYSLIEAARSGLIIVAMKVGNITDFLTNDYNGLLVESEDATGMAQAVIKIFTGRIDASKFSERIFEESKKINSLNATVEWLRILKSEN